MCAQLFLNTSTIALFCLCFIYRWRLHQDLYMTRISFTPNSLALTLPFAMFYDVAHTNDTNKPVNTRKTVNKHPVKMMMSLKPVMVSCTHLDECCLRHKQKWNLQYASTGLIGFYFQRRGRTKIELVGDQRVQPLWLQVFVWHVFKRDTKFSKLCKCSYGVHLHQKWRLVANKIRE